MLSSGISLVTQTSAKDSLSGGGKRNTLFLAQMYSEIIKNEKFLYSFSFNWNGEGGVQKFEDTEGIIRIV
jgi:hypothetical protein